MMGDIGVSDKSDRACVPSGLSPYGSQAKPLVPDAEREYRGWAITWDYGQYWAVSPNYDASWEGEEDGWVDNGLRTSARTIEALKEEVDVILDE